MAAPPLRPDLVAAMQGGRLALDALLRAASGTLLGGQAPRLPAPPLLGFDHVFGLATTGGAHGHGGASARADLDRFGWAFQCHFADDPVLPGCLLLDALLQLVGFYGAARGLSGSGRATRVGAVRFLAEVTPAAGFVQYDVAIRLVSLRRRIIVADGSASIHGEVCMTARDLVVVTVDRG